VARPRISLKARALRYLSAREHSRLELARKLTRHLQDGDDLNQLLDWLVAQKFLSDSRFAESLVNRRAARYGSSRILSELQSHGLGDEAVSTLRISLLEEENERAFQVWEKKFGVAATSHEERAKQMRFLQQRGFSNSAIQYVIKRARHIEPS
jgi:regulatory protein